MAKDIYLQCVQIRPSCYRALYIYVTKKMGKYIIIIQKITFKNYSLFVYPFTSPLIDIY